MSGRSLDCVISRNAATPVVAASDLSSAYSISIVYFLPPTRKPSSFSFSRPMVIACFSGGPSVE